MHLIQMQGRYIRTTNQYNSQKKAIEETTEVPSPIVISCARIPSAITTITDKNKSLFINVVLG